MIYFIVLLLGLWKAESHKVSTDLPWSETCPTECQCQISHVSETLISRWKTENSSENIVKTAICVLKQENLNSNFQLPNDVESITFLQAHDDVKTIFTNDFLKRFETVQIIDLQGSQSNATYITNDAFHNLQELKYLALQRVNVTGANKAFSKLPSLEVLYIIYCSIGYLKWEMLDGLKSLKELYLLQSGIKELYGFAFYGTPQLRRLFLSHNDLFSVEADAFVGLLKLEYLDLSNNRIDHLSGLTFPPLPHLQWLDLKHNPIKVIFPHCFQFLNGTQHLTLGHKLQPVHLMKFSFRGLYSLKFLHIPNIDNDALFEHMFYDLRSLLHLNLHGRIKVINNRAFNGAHTMLRKLILQKCKLEKLHRDSFHGLENLHTLDLSSNFLQSLEEGTFQTLNSIQHIFLNNNKLKQIPSDFFHLTLKSAALYDNPWNCSCQMKNWNEDIIMANYVPPDVENCNESYNCTKNTVQIGRYDADFTPKCDYPKTYQSKSVFTAIISLNCGNFN